MERRFPSVAGRVARGAARTLALAALLAVTMPEVALGSAKRDYERALARVEALRLDGPRPTPRPQVRRVITECETVARKHAGSGYADNALWQGANTALGAFRVWRQPADRTRAVELLDQLVRRYPSSSLATQARALIRRHTPAPVAAARTPARPRVAPAASTATTVPAPRPDDAVAPTLVSSPTPPPAPAMIAVPAEPRGEAGHKRVATLRGLRRTAVGDVVRLTLDFDDEVSFDQERLAGPDRVYFDFARTTAIPALADTVLQFEGPAVRRVRLGRPRPDVTRLVIDLDGIATYSVFALYNPYRLTIDLQPQRPPTLSASAAPAPTPPAPRLDPRPGPVVLPAAMPAPAAPPALLRTRAVSTARVATAVVPPSRVVEVEPPLAVDPSSLAWATATRPIETAPAVRPRTLGAPPPLLKASRRAYLVRAAIRPPRGLPVGLDLARAVPADRTPGRRETRDARAAAPVAPVTPLPIVPAPPAENGNGGFSIARQLGLGVSRIVIDPGHGGKDPGAPGPKTTEAEVVLDVALRLEKLLAASPGIEVVLTRRDDTFVQLEERTAMANRHGADLFVSIHANSSRNRKAAGVETYILNFATTADAEAVAARENATASGSMRNLPDMVKAIAQNNKRDESRELADAVQQAMVQRLRPHNPPLRDLGVKQAPFVVLIGAGMPSILAEIAFISHEGEGGLLRTAAYRQRIAEALGAAILRYTRTLKPIGTVASQDE